MRSIPKGPVNRDHPGLYKPYFHAYKKWRNDGLDKAQAAVENGQRIFALTLDLKSYYDCIDARCLRRLRPSGNLITSAFYKSLEAWQEQFGDYHGVLGKRLGIPVGLVASGLVANLILQKLDHKIEDCLEPIYYGRYVDDIFLVFQLNGKFQDGAAVMEEVARLLREESESKPEFRWHLPQSAKGNDKGLLEFKWKHWGDSVFDCNTTKQRLFCLDGKPGRDLLAVMDRELKEQSSEWRMVPDLEDRSDQMLKELLTADGDAFEGVNTLRQADDLSIKRMG